jgi:hypothetical protein
MREREALRRYHLELGGALALYLAVLFSAIRFYEAMEPGLVRTLLIVSPMLPVFLMAWAIARQFRRMDEFVRLRSLESMAIGAAVTAGFSLTYGFLELAGFPKLTMFWVWGIMGGTWGIVHALRCLVKR